MSDRLNYPTKVRLQFWTPKIGQKWTYDSSQLLVFTGINHLVVGDFHE